ncbi:MULTISPECIES: acyl-CoA dehydrogenase family protein [Vibrio]|jgi:alkylation response protein AidB-like acyl-CoA dehydrogenase|uniref:acyl-CoA dehydrogenase family protein n=1 Tax=Vibrio TaxID=662 RepID=UPI000BFFE582|nr:MULTISPECIES: acyl-CoA dehydrogenase family protein [unclassified Vibrio]PHJ41853.1 acyl-CoA dehydrogenase [Vibrio sp. PID17_43]RIZ53005.1 acyl-CoA dehydrogenase [Vibrio sp. PID23_8]
MSDKDLFRQEVRAWLEENCPVSLRTPTPDDELVWGGSQIEFKTEDQRLWFERMRDKGWFCPGWPKEYGGGGLDATQENILEQEIRRLGCRPAQINLGIWMLGPVVLKYGTEAQKQRILTPMTRGEVRWCQGFSEPNAGSDLANIRTTAKEDGDDYIVNGAKIWTSYGNKSDWMYALVRTDNSGSKHHGISLLLMDMHAPGVTVSPIDLISGKSSFCEVHFDEVRVPKNNLIGEPNLGWSLAKQLLQHERAAMSKFGEFSLPTHYDLLALSKAYLSSSPVANNASLKARITAADMEEQAYALTVQRMTEEARSGLDVSGTMSIMKLVHTEQEKIKFELLLDVMGYRGLGWQDDAFSEQELGVTRAWLNSFTQTIAGGSSEIQLNVIAKRVLNLPDASKVEKTQ